ncbi:hypothetical protein FB45DRAFT_1007355, partial [Roridomyces roridus]
MPIKKPHPPGDRELTQLRSVVSRAGTVSGLIREVSRVLDLPDCQTSRGLKQCHESFVDISSALEALYASTRGNADDETIAHERLAMIVIAIYGRMAEDAILRQRILSETDFLEKVMEMISSPSLGEMVLSILSDLSHFPDMESLCKISRFTTTILSCAESHLEQVNYAEKAVCVVSHIITAAFAAGEPDPIIKASIPRFLQFALQVAGLPASGRTSFNHLVMFCYQLSDQPSAFFSTPDAVDFLVACTRAKDIYIRITAQRALIALCADFEPEIGRPHVPLPPRPLSARVEDALEKFYGNSPRSSFTGTEAEFAELESLTEAFRTNARPRADIGQALARMTLGNEMLIRTWRRWPGKEFFAEMLPACEAAVRKSKQPGADVDADILYLVHLLSISEQQAAYAFARPALERHPSVAFFYYVMAACGRLGFQSVLFANKGRECPSLTDFLRQRLLFFSALSTLNVVPAMVQGTADEVRLQDVHLLLETAAKNADAWIDIAPPDDPHRPPMAAVGIHIDFILRGHAMTEVDFEAAEDKLTFSCDLIRSTEVGWRNPERECIVLEKIFDRMPNAWKKWGPTVLRRPSDVYPTRSRDDPINGSTSTADPQAELVSWLAKLDTNSTPGTPDSLEVALEIRGINPGARRYGKANMACCASCNTASAVLKQCAGCQKARYCDDVCQKRHWKVHREACKANRL